MDRMIKILKYLKNYQRVTVCSMTSDMDISKDEIEELCDLGILYESRWGIDSFSVSDRKRTNRIIELLLSSQKEITKQELFSLGISDYYIKKLLKDGRIVQVGRGIYHSREVNPKTEDTHIPQNLTVTEEIMQAIEKENLDEVLKILEETQGNEFIKLSRNLWKWVLPKIIKKETFISDSHSVVEENIEPMEVGETVSETMEDVSFSDSTLEEAEEAVPMVVSEEKTKKEVISFEELLDLFYLNLESDPIIAKEYIMQYKRMCENKKIIFNYNLLSLVNIEIANLGVSSKQLDKEKELLAEVKQLLQTSPSTDEFNKIMNEFDYLYQDRGVLSNLYHGLYEESRNNDTLAASYFREVLAVEPWNEKALYGLSRVLYYSKDPDLLRVNKQLLKYYPEVSNWLIRYEIAKSYIGKYGRKAYKAYSELRKISDFEVDNQSPKYKKRYLNGIIERLEKELEYQIRWLEKADEGDVIPKVKNIRLINEEIEYYKETLNCLEISTKEIKKATKEDEFMMPYMSDIIDFMNCDSNDGSISFPNVEVCINQLGVEEEERMLYYLAAARVFLLNHYPKQAEHYLKLVRNTKNKPEIIKKQYEQLERNKTLYLNKKR